MIRCLIVLFCCLANVHCASDSTMGYSSSSLFATSQFRSITVPIFQNRTMHRDIEFMLTDAVIKEIQVRTPYRVVTEEFADTQLVGTITSVDLQTVSQSRLTGLSGEMLIKVVIDFEWLNLRSGGRIVGRENFASSELFIPSRPSSEPIEMGLFSVVQQLATDIVDQMQASW